MSADAFAWWRDAVGGNQAPINDQPRCGYFKMRDRRGKWQQAAPIKRPFIACAIWLDEDGSMKAEFDGLPCPVDDIWPFCAKYPIPYEDYHFWHTHLRWPEEAVDA